MCGRKYLRKNISRIGRNDEFRNVSQFHACMQWKLYYYVYSMLKFCRFNSLLLYSRQTFTLTFIVSKYGNNFYMF